MGIVLNCVKLPSVDRWIMDFLTRKPESLIQQTRPLKMTEKVCCPQSSGSTIKM